MLVSIQGSVGCKIRKRFRRIRNRRIRNRRIRNRRIRIRRTRNRRIRNRRNAKTPLRDNQRTRLCLISVIWINCVWKKSVDNEALVLWPSRDFRRDMTCHDVTWRDTTWHYVTLHDVAWRGKTWYDVTWHDVTWNDVTWRDIMWHYVTLRDITWHYVTLCNTDACVCTTARRPSRNQ